MKALLSLALPLIMTNCNMHNDKTDTPLTLETIQDSKYEVGQVWKYTTRPSEDSSTLTVVKIEQQAKVGVIVHVYIDGLRVKTNKNKSEFSSTITHSPFSKAALDSSVIRVVSVVDDLPDYKEGYIEWRESFLTGNAGVFSIPVSKSIDYMEQTIINGTETSDAP